MRVKKRRMKYTRYLLLTLLVLFFFGPLALIGYAQGEDPPATVTPVESEALPQEHTIQEGENLTTIAEQYGITVAELMLVNGLDENDLIYPGQTLIIPGGANGELVVTTHTVQGGDTLESLAEQFATTVEAIAESNHLISSDSLYLGQTLTIISHNGSAEPTPIEGRLHVVQPGETLLMIGARLGLSPARIAEVNGLSEPWRVYPGMRLRIPLRTETDEARYQYLPAGWQTLRLQPLPILQGETVSIYVEHSQAGAPAGEFAGQPLHFAPYQAGYVALVGLDAFTEAVRHQLRLSGGDNDWWPLEQQVQVSAANYPTQTITVPQELAPLLDPQVRADEDAFLSTIYGQFTPEQQWEGLFQEPVSNTIVTAPYGGIRSYNGGPFDIFHTGVDFGGTTGTPIMAPAAGTIVFSDTLELRGNTVIIDHGLGVMSGYYHLSEIQVQVGQRVEAGQVIGLGGSTGLSTGPHLHWELRVMDIPVNGMQWTQRRFP